ncbi:MAG: outer membrane beta-barrel protein [Pseudomonadota bacterium]
MSGVQAKTGLLTSVAAVALLSFSMSASAEEDKFGIEDRLSSHDWSGPYLGIHLGLSGLNSDGDHQFTTSSRIDLGTLDDIGFLGGGHIGWNFVEDDTLIGIEGDYSFIDHDEFALSGEDFPPPDTNPESIVYDADYFATIRGRVGKVDDDVLFYATGGIAFTGGDLNFTGSPGTNTSIDADFAGPVFGVGLEWAASHNVRFRTEWLHASFRDSEQLTNFDSVQTEDSFIPDDILAIRAGVSWNYDGAPTFSFNEDEEAHDWAGLFVGGYIGSGTLVTSGIFDTTDSNSLIDLGSLAEAGLLGGGTIGWNFQQDNLVLGVQAEISFVDWDGTARETNSRVDRIELDTDYIATIRGRLGHADGDLLVYGTAGVALIEGDLIDPTGTSTGQNIGFDETGMVVGGGMEWAATENLSVQVEGLYFDFDESTNLANIGGGDPGDAFVLEDGILAKVGVNWSFN